MRVRVHLLHNVRGIYVEPLKVYLAKHREAVKGDKPEKDGKSKGKGDDDAADDDE